MSWAHVLGPTAVVLGLALFVTGRFDHRSLAVRTFVILGSWCLSLRYFWWRASSTIPDEAGWIIGAAWLLLLVEVLSQVIAQANYVRAAWHYVDRSKEADDHQGWWGKHPPLVDIFIPTYNESVEVVSKTITGALGQSYPNFRVWVLDDGRRDWMRDYCKERDVHYVRRGDNRHYKSGNLNHALAHIRRMVQGPDLIAVFDADFVARPGFLMRTVALMYDERTALVQTPQEFFNPDPIQYAFNSQHQWPDDLRFLFSVRLRGLDGLGNSSCCGTSFLVRASSIDAIGGFPTESVTEDLLTAVKIGGIGQRCVYLKEPLSTGLAAEGLTEHLNQRARWALGLVEVATGDFSPAKSARWPMSWVHLVDFSLRWCLPLLLRNVFLWIPVIGWLTDSSLIVGDPVEAAYVILPMMVFRLLCTWIEEGANLPVFSDAMTLLPSLAIVRSSLGGLLRPGSRPFKVTDKGKLRDGVTVHWSPLLYFGSVIVLSIVGMLVQHFTREAITLRGVVGMRVWWTCYDILVCTLALVPCLERPKYRFSERFRTDEPVRIELGGAVHQATLFDLSTSGASVRVAANVTVGDLTTLHVEGCDALPAEVVRKDPRGWLGLRFESTEARAQSLTRKLYCSFDYIKPAEHWTPLRAWSSLVKWGFS